MLLHRRQHLFPQLGRLPPALRDEVMLAAVRRLPQLASVLGAMRGLAFVSTESGELRPPSALHDPRCAVIWWCGRCKPAILQRMWPHVRFDSFLGGAAAQRS